MVRRTKQDAEKTRQSLMDAAEILFLEQGVTRTSLDQVARKAGVTRGAVYWHFKNKWDLLHGLIERTDIPLDEMLEALVEDFSKASTGESKSDSQAVLDAIRGALEHFYRQLEADEAKQRVMVILINRIELVGEMDDLRLFYENKNTKTIGALEKLISIAQSQGEVRPDCIPRLAAATIHSLMIGTFLDFTCMHGSNALKEAPELFRPIWDGLRCRKASH